MRNASDIFCLKELKDGDTNGTEMFSVNGKCQLTKINRRRNLHTQSTTFEYGTISPSKLYPDRIKEMVPSQYEQTEDIEQNDVEIDDIKEQLSELELCKEEMDDNEKSEDIDDICSMKSTPEKNSKGKPSIKKATVGEGQVSCSAMTRNPLTGAGMETEQFKKSKKGSSRREKWSW
ncbi:hypothetical protein GWI33_018452 [Rhynchophorus ferrugineus]|uniref:Uncharacterized protein n=1 Tax=Rhynchophorus ferrugineus TaxID=354439 RepID=A0A834HVZ7_RHYFE|nr:hypothetical protein GWI33_018452 [Rhynchophorus ferrugineus]